jgi:acyl-CoA dehydrogenase
MGAFEFELGRLPESTRALREEVRAFLAGALRDMPPWRRAYTWTGYDRDFSRRVGARGWIGMTWPQIYGGGGRSALERYVVLEEMLSAGAPVGAHWVGDRQSGPLLLRYGTEAQRERFLPRICTGEITFCIGMSEPDSGSDLASIRARADRADGAYRVNGTKLWTSGAHSCDYMIALLRTTVVPDNRHAGLSQFLIDLKTPGITIRPIRDLSGSDHFCEVTFEDAIVPEDMRIGEEGSGWTQVLTELAFERSGPERYLSCYPLLTLLMGELGAEPGDRGTIGIGRQVARLATLRSMSIAVAGLLEAGKSPILEACVVKDQGGVFEQELPGFAQGLIEAEPRWDEGASEYQKALALLTQIAPSFSLRGGTREILRGIIARGLGLR